jgi:hypothetical protein
LGRASLRGRCEPCRGGGIPQFVSVLRDQCAADIGVKQHDSS